MRHCILSFQSFSAVAAVLFLCCCLTGEALATSSQSIVLRPGWNAVYLEVQPEVKDPTTVFKDLPVETVWTWFDRGTAIEFIRDPSEGLWAQPGWSVYAKTADKAAATNLYAILANRAYLIKLAGRQTVTWTVSGTAATGNTVWTADSLNLTGFHVNPANPPTFAEFLAPSPSLKGQPVYRLSVGGAWEQVVNPATTTINPGEAYWVYCSGPSTYQGPVNVQLIGSMLDFGTTSTLSSITLGNASAATRTVTVKFLPAADWFTYQSFNAATGYNEYPKLDTWTFPIYAGRQSNLWLAVRWELLPVGMSRGNLEVTDDVGSRRLIPVQVEKLAQ